MRRRRPEGDAGSGCGGGSACRRRNASGCRRGAATFPLHAHFANEEMILVLEGRPSLTCADGEMRGLEPGDVVACPAGREGAHRLDNHGDEPARVLIVSTMRAPEINEMLEDGTFWVRDYAPGLTPEDPSLDVPGLRRTE